MNTKKGDNDDLHHTYKVMMRLNPGSTDQIERGEVEVFVKPSQVEKVLKLPTHCSMFSPNQHQM